MTTTSDFYGLGIAPGILTILDKLGFKVPTPIQLKAIPVALEGKDVMGLAQTGTGKTLAFAIPMMQAALKGTQGLIVLPTRELALQVQETIEKVGGPLGIRTALLIGGAPISMQIRSLSRNPIIVIGTPGRIIDHLQQKTISLKRVGILVLDEADRMLDMGFAPQLKRILTDVPKERQTMLFSATMPDNIMRLANAYMQLPLRIEIAPPGTTITKIAQEVFFISKMDKPRLLEKVLYEYKGSVLIFSRTKFGAKKIATSVRALGHTAAEIHSNRSLNQRREALDGFRNGKYRILVATDIAARGIDVKGIELVLNYDLPSNPEDYIHRIGRTARAGATGHAISFAMPDERRDVQDIERLMRATLPFSKLPELPPARAVPYSSRTELPPRGRAPFRGGSSSGSRPSYRQGGAPHSSGPRPSYGSSSSRSPRSGSRFPKRNRY
ncbi:MAG: DEAD/DEAH box helicase [Candidatus Pacebacteria bacterium]|nr:DEAD/DEAH box helicase [Candidatus Paceibacterota bacterium]